MRKLNINEYKELKLALNAFTHAYGESKGILLFYRLFAIIEEIK